MITNRELPAGWRSLVVDQYAVGAKRKVVSRGKYHKWTTADIKKIAAMLADGVARADVAAAFGCSNGALYRVIKRFNLGATP